MLVNITIRAKQTELHMLSREWLAAGGMLTDTASNTHLQQRAALVCRQYDIKLQDFSEVCIKTKPQKNKHQQKKNPSCETLYTLSHASNP